MPPKLWHWQYFQTCPHNPESDKDSHGKNTLYSKAWCRGCISACTHAMRERDSEDLARGIISDTRSEDELLREAFSTVLPISGRREAFEPHIRSCKLVNPKAKEKLAREQARSRSPTRSSPFPLVSTQDSSSNNEALVVSTPPSALYELSKAQQAELESDLCKLWVANGWAWHGINAPETQTFFQKWLPAATQAANTPSGPFRLLDGPGPGAGDGTHGLDIFKSNGLANLQLELELYGLATREKQKDLEIDDEND